MSMGLITVIARGGSTWKCWLPSLEAHSQDFAETHRFGFERAGVAQAAA